MFRIFNRNTVYDLEREEIEQLIRCLEETKLTCVHLVNEFKEISKLRKKGKDLPAGLTTMIKNELNRILFLLHNGDERVKKIIRQQLEIEESKLYK